MVCGLIGAKVVRGGRRADALDTDRRGTLGDIPACAHPPTPPSSRLPCALAPAADWRRGAAGARRHAHPGGGAHAAGWGPRHRLVGWWAGGGSGCRLRGAPLCMGAAMGMPAARACKPQPSCPCSQCQCSQPRTAAGKSQFQKYVAKLAPRAVVTSGRASSAVRPGAGKTGARCLPNSPPRGGWHVRGLRSRCMIRPALSGTQPSHAAAARPAGGPHSGGGARWRRVEPGGGGAGAGGWRRVLHRRV